LAINGVETQSLAKTMVRVQTQQRPGNSGYLVVFDDGSVGVIEELVDAPKEDEGWDVPRIDLCHLIVSVSGICKSSV
jgi:Asp/Glu/hydantoin racemase